MRRPRCRAITKSPSPAARPPPTHSSAQTSTATPVPTTNTGATVQAGASATVNGTVKAVDVLAHTVTLAVQGSADLVLTFMPQSKITVNGSATTAAALGALLGKPASATYTTD